MYTLVLVMYIRHVYTCEMRLHKTCVHLQVDPSPVHEACVHFRMSPVHKACVHFRMSPVH